MNVDWFDYPLPSELIAQEPLKDREKSRLLVLNRENAGVEHRVFSDIEELLCPGDCLVLNDTRVIPARLLGSRADSGGFIEFLLLHRHNTTDWEVSVRPGRRAKPGSRFVFGDVLYAEVLRTLEGGNRLVRFEYEGLFENLLDKLGKIPLPHYITRELMDKERYQTVYSRHEGSAAAPTAGLHFTNQLLDRIQAKGVDAAFLTLHVGLGTFRPVKTERVEEHHMHSEFYVLDKENARKVNHCRERGGRVVAVGTTSCRVLETVTDPQGYVCPQSGWTDIFIYPGYSFKAVDALITNFHLPKSTLMMLVSAFGGRQAVMDAYRDAIKQRYRFFSFGDAMIIV